MNYKIIIFIYGLLIILALIFLKCSMNTSSSGTAEGNYNDIVRYIEGLMSSEADDSFIIITIKGTQDFMQMSCNSTNIQIDFPLVTEYQKNNEQKILNALKKLNLNYYYNTGSDSSKFIDIDIKDNAFNTAQVCKNILIELFSVNESTVLEFKFNGFNLSTTT